MPLFLYIHLLIMSLLFVAAGVIVRQANLNDINHQSLFRRSDRDKFILTSIIVWTCFILEFWMAVVFVQLFLSTN